MFGYYKLFMVALNWSKWNTNNKNMNYCIRIKFSGFLLLEK